MIYIYEYSIFCRTVPDYTKFNPYVKSLTDVRFYLYMSQSLQLGVKSSMIHLLATLYLIKQNLL